LLELDIPGYGALALSHLVLDVNGTLTNGGVLVPGVAEVLAELRGVLKPVILTADTRGTATSLGEALGVEVRVIKGEWEAGEKLAVVQDLGPDGVVAIGNGANDALVLSSCAVGICVIGPEGASKAALESADLVVTSLLDALALLADPDRLLATLRR
jgi:P-type E1-E2 ATPase